MEATSLSLSGQIQALIKRRSMLSHEFYLAWSRGTLPKDAIKLYAAQYYRHVEAFPRYVSGIHANCDQLEVRQKLLENLIDEERGEENHPALWLSFAKSLGLTESTVRSTTRWPETDALVTTFLSITKTGDYREGLGALLAYESQIPGVARAKIDGLATFYGISDREAIQFFEVHLNADEFHSETVRNVLDADTPPTLVASVLAAADRALEALWHFLDAALRHASVDVASSH